jgi:hypothetical protein
MNIDERLDKIESMLAVLVERQQVREWYSTQEFAQAVGKAEFTIRECHRALQNQPLMGASKPATTLGGFGHAC